MRVAETICVPKRDIISEAWINISKSEREKYKIGAGQAAQSWRARRRVKAKKG